MRCEVAPTSQSNAARILKAPSRGLDAPTPVLPRRQRGGGRRVYRQGWHIRAAAARDQDADAPHRQMVPSPAGARRSSAFSLSLMPRRFQPAIARCLTGETPVCIPSGSTLMGYTPGNHWGLAGKSALNPQGSLSTRRRWQGGSVAARIHALRRRELSQKWPPEQAGGLPDALPRSY